MVFELPLGTLLPIDSLCALLAGLSASTTDTGGVPAQATRGSSDQEKGEEGGSLSWLAKAAAGSSDRPTHTAGKSITNIVATQGTATTDDDWLATAASGAAHAHPSPSRRPSTETTAAGKRGSGGGWLTAAAGTVGLPLLDGNGDGSVSDGVNSALHKKKGPEQGNASAAQSGGAGGWMAKAVLSGYLADTALSEDNTVDDVASRAEPVRQGKTIATQTDEVVGQAAAERAKPKLPPWAKPWSAPAPATVSDPVSTPATGADSVVGEGTGLNRRTSYESSTSDTKGKAALFQVRNDSVPHCFEDEGTDGATANIFTSLAHVRSRYSRRGPRWRGWWRWN